MTIQSMLFDRLTTESGVSALVGARVYPGLLPQKATYPAISYGRVSNSGQWGTGTHRESRFQFDCWAKTNVDVVALSAAVKGGLEEWGDVDGGYVVKMAWIVNELDDYDPEEDLYRITLDCMLITSGD